ncbi:hypothetical protein RSOLAG1IB_06488 [Rhizoctonia solani AG-1 IB]|uniref:Zn(2)-C6 fungal-type domain-containing protein n=1 Tax=Thanatephorus cucumeris (strain AG1-IB / isolate 7/3/14) TaxID=1108050 RepID=A0A0B7FBS8_THACB|nr:hypothetical protein RSOLAG1IB_06488 [Rhizoctonia solani AG-1 IB]
MPRKLPGPAGTSCLTCKLRHKRCDKRQPECERCVKGGYDCLGYNHIRPTSRHRQLFRDTIYRRSFRAFKYHAFFIFRAYPYLRP